VFDLRERQIEEKRRAFQNFLPESTLKELMMRLSKEEEEELRKYRAQMEKEKQEKLRELDEKRARILKEMEAQGRNSTRWNASTAKWNRRKPGVGEKPKKRGSDWKC